MLQDRIGKADVERGIRESHSVEVSNLEAHVIASRIGRRRSRTLDHIDLNIDAYDFARLHDLGEANSYRAGLAAHVEETIPGWR